ncbi:MAG: hypothetical protein M0C28_05165 [Candidatus Moduliflexus flocculans]|nr:hypothetical protein [Candidatus Moduliflexus flocculans]
MPLAESRDRIFCRGTKFPERTGHCRPDAPVRVPQSLGQALERRRSPHRAEPLGGHSAFPGVP